jgi:hypothetical protein
VIEVALETYRRQRRKRGAVVEPRVATRKRTTTSAHRGWEKWVGYCRKSFEEMGNPSVDEYIEMVRGR